MSHRRSKVFDNTNKLTTVKTVTKKRYWVILDNKDRLFTNGWDKYIPMFYRRRDVIDYMRQYSLEETHKPEKLEVTVIR